MRNMINLKYIILFVAGFITCFLAIYSLSFISLEKPLQVGGFKQLSTLQESSSPGDWISSNNIEVYKDKVIIKLDNPTISSYASTGSMRPTLDIGHNGIRIKPKSANEIKIGDIVTFQKENDLIVHRVIEKEQDENRTWFITKGDNNIQSDEKIYFEDIKYITVGVLY